MDTLTYVKCTFNHIYVHLFGGFYVFLCLILCVFYTVKAPQLPFSWRLCSHVVEQVILCNDMTDNLLENGV